GWIRVLRVDSDERFLSLDLCSQLFDGVVCLAANPINKDIYYVSLYESVIKRIKFMDGIPGDIDHDGTVGPGDLSALLGAWGQCPQPPRAGNCPADLDEDGTVGPGDLSIL